MTQRSHQSLLTRLATVFCTIVMFFGLVAAPSFAGGIFGGGASDSPTPNIVKDAEEFAGPDKQPMSMEEIQARGRDGLNEIQGTDDANKMSGIIQSNKPDNVIARKIEKETKSKSN